MFNEFPHLTDESILQAAYSKISATSEPAAQSGEAPVQQLKAAIALVREAGMRFGFGGGVAFTADEFLKGIEQRAAV